MKGIERYEKYIMETKEGPVVLRNGTKIVVEDFVTDTLTVEAVYEIQGVLVVLMRSENTGELEAYDGRFLAEGVVYGSAEVKFEIASGPDTIF